MPKAASSSGPNFASLAKNLRLSSACGICHQSVRSPEQRSVDPPAMSNRVALDVGLRQLPKLPTRCDGRDGLCLRRPLALLVGSADLTGAFLRAGRPVLSRDSDAEFAVAKLTHPPRLNPIALLVQNFTNPATMLKH